MSEQMKKEALSYGIPYEKKGRTLIWHDEFDKPQLDRSKWCFVRTMGASDREFDNSEYCCRIVDNKLLMQVHKSGLEDKDYRLPEGLCTRETMVYQYGYVEMRARLSYRHGAWPSFWLQSATPFAKAPYMSEIDVLEAFSSPHTLHTTLHKWGGGQHTALKNVEKIGYPRSYTFQNPETLNDEYHVYGFEWDPHFMTFYVDDCEYAKFPIDESGADLFEKEEVFPRDQRGFHDFHYLIMNDEIFSRGGSWNPEGWILTEDDPLPIEYSIDWVRLYQNPETEKIKYAEDIAQARKEKEAK